MLGEKWKLLEPEEKAKYTAKAAKLKVEFRSQHPDYVFQPKKANSNSYANSHTNLEHDESDQEDYDVNSFLSFYFLKRFYFWGEGVIN